MASGICCNVNFRIELFKQIVNQMKIHFSFLSLLAVLLFSCSSPKTESEFTFKKNDQGVELLENGQPVFFYQKMPKSLDGKYVCNNYLHPLYSLNGDTLTEEFPDDHPYHRGIFWAWHQIYVNHESVGDGWIMENIEQEVVNVKTSNKDQSVLLTVNVLWKSPLYEKNKPFLSENTEIKVHPKENGIRKIDFAISLKALVPEVKIGGSDDEKGYGGLCARVKLPDDLTFTSEEGEVIPQTLQIEAGPYMDFSASFDNTREVSGVSLLCHPETPNYPAPWILRSKTSMQNIVYPGRDPVTIPVDEPVNLYYRMIVHNGNANSINLNSLQSEYENTEVAKEENNILFSDNR
jgi:hypothetical protein